MKEEVGSSALDHEVTGTKRSRIRCILICVTLITLLGLVVALVIVFAYSTEPPGLEVHPSNLLVMESWKDTRHNRELVESLDTFAAEYDNLGQSQELMECHDDDRRDGKCVFKLTWLRSPCTKADRWGFNNWKPCILLSFKGGRDWVPKPYTSPDELPEEMPKSLRKHITEVFRTNSSTKFLWVSCDGHYPADVEMLGDVKLGPWQGFPTYYFPLRHDTVQAATPLLALHVPDALRSALITIRCHFWAKNLPSPHLAANIEYLMD